MIVEEAQTGRRVNQFTSGPDGRFSVALAPGNYRLVPLSPQGAILPRAEPLEVTVPPNQFVEVTIQYDSGIR